MTNDFGSALKRFEDGLYPDAETRFESFTAAYTNSPLLPRAVLYQARSRYCQSNYSGAISLLRGNFPKAGAQADFFQYWIGESQLALGNGFFSQVQPPIGVGSGAGPRLREAQRLEQCDCPPERRKRRFPDRGPH